MVVDKSSDTELRFKNPGLLLLVVLGFVFWGVGFLDLLGHTSAEPTVFGRYSLPFFIFIILYGCTIVIWFALFFNSSLLLRVAGLVGVIQGDIRLAIAAFGGMGFAFWIIFEWDRWTRLPGLQFGAFGLTMLAFLILLFANWNKRTELQKWRLWIAYPLFVLMVLEGVIQIMAWLVVLPGVHRIGGDFYPYERIYYNGEGFFQNDFANRYGWNFLDARLDDRKKRILIVGGSYVQALPIPPEKQFGVVLSENINQHQTDMAMQVEIVSIGMPGFGLSPFLYEDSITEFPNTIKFDEIIVMFHLGDDFQSPSMSNNPIIYSVSETNEVEVNPDHLKLRHDLTHYFLRSYLSFQLVETVRSNYLTPKVIDGLLYDWSGERWEVVGSTGDELNFPRLVGFVNDTYTFTEPSHAGIRSTDLKIIPGGNNFMFIQDRNKGVDEAIAIAGSMLATANEIAIANGITLRVVTIPLFPEEFYNTYQSGDWGPIIDKFDLLLPERALIEIAEKNNIPILPMGQYMLKDQLTAEQIKALYLSNNLGSLSPEGHDYFANALYMCFYSNNVNPICSK